jgi:hypothetical protein
VDYFVRNVIAGWCNLSAGPHSEKSATDLCTQPNIAQFDGLRHAHCGQAQVRVKCLA